MESGGTESKRRGNVKEKRYQQGSEALGSTWEGYKSSVLGIHLPNTHCFVLSLKS